MTVSSSFKRRYPALFSLPRLTPFDALLFLYFFTLHADQLHMAIGSYNLRLNNGIALLLAMVAIWHYRKQVLVIDRTLGLLTLLSLVAVLLSASQSAYPRRVFLFVGWYGFTLLFYFFLPYLLLRNEGTRKIVTLYLASFLAVGGYLLLQLLLSFVGIEDPFASQRIFGSIVRPNAFCYEPSYYALYMTPFIIMVNYHFLRAPEAPFFSFKALTWTQVLCYNFLYFVSTSTSTFFILILFCGSTLWMREVRARAKSYLIVVSGLFGLLALLSPYLMKTFFLKFFSANFMKHGSFLPRWQGIVSAWQIFLTHPWLGIGWGAYPSYLYEAWASGNTSLPYPVGLPDNLMECTQISKLFEPTNVCTELLASLGIVGTLPFLALIYLLIRRGREATRNAPILAKGLLLAALLQLIALQFNPTLLRTYVWAHLGITFALFDQMRAPVRHDTIYQKGYTFG